MAHEAPKLGRKDSSFKLNSHTISYVYFTNVYDARKTFYELMDWRGLTQKI